MASMYSAKVMEHFANPHNVGEIPDANGVGEVGNPKCGDIMRMYLKIENNVIVDVILKNDIIEKKSCVCIVLFTSSPSAAVPPSPAL